MKFVPQNTLAYHLRHPTQVPLQMTDTPVPALVDNVRQFMQAYAVGTPEASALTFYAMNDLMGKLRQAFSEHEALPDWALTVVNHYTNWMSLETRRMLAYILIICTRESRHLSSAVTKNWIAEFRDKFGDVPWDFLEKNWEKNEIAMVEAFLKSPPDCKLGDYIEGLVYMFNEGSWGGSVGGKAWGNIAETLARVVRGETSLEVMMDTAYTLAHNCGPMFNKGHLYQHFTSLLYTVLDVQRAGMIPELLKSDIFKHMAEDGGFKTTKVPKEIPAFVYECIELVSTNLVVIGDTVDWQKVEDLGSVHKYPQFKKLAKQLESEKLAAAIAAKKAAQLAATPVAPVEMKVAILPGVEVKTMSRGTMKALKAGKVT